MIPLQLWSQCNHDNAFHTLGSVTVCTIYSTVTTFQSSPSFLILRCEAHIRHALQLGKDRKKNKRIEEIMARGREKRKTDDGT